MKITTILLYILSLPFLIGLLLILLVKFIFRTKEGKEIMLRKLEILHDTLEKLSLDLKELK